MALIRSRMLSSDVNGKGPNQADVQRITNLVVDQLGTVEMDVALTVICNLAGQLLCALCEGQPMNVKTKGDIVLQNIRRAAMAKMIYDDEQRRKQQG